MLNKLLLGFMFVALCSYGAQAQENKMKLQSTAFLHHAEIPAQYTCEGQDISPPLHWSDVPATAKTLALIVDDPDAPDPAAPKLTWVHWVLYNLPVNSSGLSEAISQLPAGTKQGLNDWKKTGYRGPCPPVGRHRYFHKLYALDIELPLSLATVTKAELEQAMQGHIVAQTELIGVYQKHSRFCSGTVFDKVFCPK